MNVAGSGNAPPLSMRQPRQRNLWLGVLLAPVGWVGAELVGYYLSARSCERTVAGVPFPGAARPTVAHFAWESVAALVAIVGLAIAIRNLRETSAPPRASRSASRGRAQFMAFTGVVASALFLFGILLFAFSGAVVNACSQST